MNEDLSDYEFQKPIHEAPVAPTRHPSSLAPWIALALLVVAVGAAVYVAFGRRPLPAETARSVVTPPAAAVPQPLGGAPEPVDLPALDESDALVRTLVRTLSEHPAVVAWLATPDLIRNFTVATANIAEGATPAKHLSRLRPAAGFRVLDSSGNLLTNPESYARYAPVADAVGSIDPAGAARLYGTLKPRIEQAYRELGVPDQSFDRCLERAIVLLLRTPILDAPIRLEPKGIGYAYADDQLESLTSAQKQLLRMGPRNVRIIERKLREIAIQLGIRESELPKSSSN
jgi:hypothetical protein